MVHVSNQGTNWSIFLTFKCAWYFLKLHRVFYNLLIYIYIYIYTIKFNISGGNKLIKAKKEI